MGLTVAVTGPTGEIGKALLSALERSEEVESVLGMARRPFDPASEGWTKVTYRQGDILDRGAVDALVAGADVVVHLAFVIFGSHEETRQINLEGTRNVFEACASAGKIQRLVYTSSVAAYGFHTENDLPLREDVEPRGTEGFYYSAQKAELEGLLAELIRGRGVATYVFRPCIVAGERATMLVEQMVKQVGLGGRLPLASALDALPFLAPVLPDSGVPFQLVHHDDVADALVSAIEGHGAPGTYNLAAEGELTLADIARALGWYSVPVPEIAVKAAGEIASRLSFLNAELEWVNALSVPVLMDTARARSEIGWAPRHTAVETLRKTVTGARGSGIIG